MLAIESVGSFLERSERKHQFEMSSTDDESWSQDEAAGESASNCIRRNENDDRIGKNNNIQYNKLKQRIATIYWDTLYDAMWYMLRELRALRTIHPT